MGAFKVPALIASSLICLVLGVGVGTVGATYLGLTTGDIKFWDREEADAAKGDKKGPPPGAPKGGMMPPKGGGPKEPSAKAQLNSLISKLDILTEKPLTVTFDDEKKKRVQEQLKDLGNLDELSEDEAKKRLEGLLDVVKDQKVPLAAVGFRWPGTKVAGGPPFELPNPFKVSPASEHLQALEKRLAAMSITAP